MQKSSIDEIRARFDADVERFSNLETGQSATIDAPLVLELITEAAAKVTPGAKMLLDVGCGAGNYSVKMLSRVAGLEVELVDLSAPMLERAKQRVTAAGARAVRTYHGDIRRMDFGDGSIDIILAAAVLHHLRNDGEWDSVFAKFHRWLRPGGSVWISDLVMQKSPPVQEMMWRRYGEYLAKLKDEAYRDTVFAYVDKEDSPQSLMFQLEGLRRAGFVDVDVLHKNGPFAAFGARRS
jgi:tRNA (cmo5U34)-methyltransferase